MPQGAPAAKGGQVFGDGKEVPLYESHSSLNLARVREFSILFGQIGFGGGRGRWWQTKKVDLGKSTRKTLSYTDAKQKHSADMNSHCFVDNNHSNIQKAIYLEVSTY